MKFTYSKGKTMKNTTETKYFDEKLGMEGVDKYVRENPHGVDTKADTFVLPEIPRSGANSVTAPISDSVGDSAFTEGEEWKKLEVEIVKACGIVDINLSKLARKVVSTVYRESDPRYATMMLRMIERPLKKYVTEFRDYFKVWGLEFDVESKNSPEYLECKRIADKDAFPALCKAIGKVSMTKVVKRYRSKMKEETVPSYEYGVTTFKAIESAQKTMASKLKSLEKRRDARDPDAVIDLQFALVESSIVEGLHDLTEKVFDAVNSDAGLDAKIVMSQLLALLPEAVKASKTAKETA